MVSLITAFRNEDQIIAVLPYFAHVDFRVSATTFPTNNPGILSYSIGERNQALLLLALFSASSRPFQTNHASRYQAKVATFSQTTLTPSNFLFDCASRQGVLVDFGLAEVCCHQTCPGN